MNLTADNGNWLLMGLAERADMIVDFTNVPVCRYVLANIGPDEPFGDGEPPDDFDVADPGSTRQIIQFRVVPAVTTDPTTPPQSLVLPPVTPLPVESVTRPLALIEMMSNAPGHDGPSEALLGNVNEDGMAEHMHWSDEVSENPNVGDTEVWEYFNFTADARPMHIHEVAFEVVNRQRITFTQ